MKIHKEGHKVLRNQIIIYLLLGIVTIFNHNFLYYATPIFSIIFLFSLYFFRVPNKIFERKDGHIYSPCDGKVVVIEETLEDEYYKDKRIQISIFMSPLNVHNNLYPLAGIVKYQKYHQGKFLVAWHPKASTHNEKNSIVVENNNISILIRQIAGAVARRIITYAKKGKNIESCDELGFIKFGSRVDVFLPTNTNINIVLGQKLIAGKSIIARY